MKKETKLETDPAPVNRMVKAGTVKVRANAHLAEHIGGDLKRFAPEDEFELPAARVAALGSLVRLALFLLAFILYPSALPAAPAGFVTKTATGSTSATVLFPGGNGEAAVVAVDVTSDKSTSVASWRYGTTPSRIAAAVAAADTNLYTWGSTVASNNIILAQNSADAVTNATVWTNTTITNVVLYLNQTLGTNLAIGDTIRKFSASSFALTNDTSATATNFPVALTNGLAANDLVAYDYYGVMRTGAVHSVLSNSFNLTATPGTNLSAWTTVFYKLTNSHPVTLPALASAAQITALNNTNLTIGDTLLISPASGGHFRRVYTGADTNTYNKVTVTAAIGITMAEGDHFFLQGATNSTPVGATTVRLYGNPVFVLPPKRPASMVLDGTSACTINQVIVNYR